MMNIQIIIFQNRNLDSLFYFQLCVIAIVIYSIRRISISIISSSITIIPSCNCPCVTSEVSWWFSSLQFRICHILLRLYFWYKNNLWS